MVDRKRLADPAESGQPEAPLAEIDAWTAPHRVAIAARHDERAGTAKARGDASWRAYGRAEKPAAPSTCKAGREPEATGKTVGAELETWELDRRVRDKRPLWDSSSHVTRVRRRWRNWRNDAGEARRSPVVKRVSVPAYEAHRSSEKWHRDRAAGQRSRRATVEHCGVGEVRVSCMACGVVHEQRVHCGIVRLCQACSRRRAQRARGRLATSLGVVLRHAEKAGMLRRYRKGGRLTEKHMILTVPHVVAKNGEGEGGEAGARFATAKLRPELLYRCWARFARRLQAWMRVPWPELGEAETIGACWYRAFEWTPGTDGMGHPHFHLLVLSTWLPEEDDHRIESIAGGKICPSTRCEAPHRIRGAWGWAETMRRERCPLCIAPERVKDYRKAPFRVAWRAPVVERRAGVRSWWADALAAEGAPTPQNKLQVKVKKAFVRPVEIVREVRKNEGITIVRREVHRIRVEDSAGVLLDYMEGWTIAQRSGDGHVVASAEVLAGVYCALEGKRISQGSKVLLRDRAGRAVRVGLMAIADARHDASCGDCNAAALSLGLGLPPFPEKTVEVVSWSRASAGRMAAPPLPPATAPPARELSPEERVAALVGRLRREAAAAASAPGVASRLVEVCALVRQEGPDLLPVYRRRKVFAARPDTMRGRLRRALGIGAGRRRNEP